MSTKQLGQVANNRSAGASKACTPAVNT